MSIFKILVSKLQGTCTGVLIFKIFVCSVLQLQRIVWTLDLKCSQRQKCKCLSWPLFRMPHVCWVLCITFAFISCHLVFTFLYLVYIWFPYFVIVILSISLSDLKKKKKKNFTFSYIPVIFSRFLYSFFFLITTFLIFLCFVQIWVLIYEFSNIRVLWYETEG